MIKFFFRSLAFLFLIIAIINVVIDAAKTVGASRLTFTNLNETIAPFLHIEVSGFNQYALSTLPSFLAGLFITIGNFPSWFIFGLVSLLFYVLGYKRPKK